MSKTLQKKELQTYYRDIRKNIAGKRENKRIFLRTLENDITNYMEEHPSANISDIYAQFGTVEDVAEAYLEETPRVSFKQSIRKHRTVLLIGGIAFTILLTFTIIFVHDTLKHRDDIIEIYIEYENDDSN